MRRSKERKPGLDVDQRDVQLRGCQCSGKRGVCVAVDNDGIGLSPEAERLRSLPACAPSSCRGRRREWRSDNAAAAMSSSEKKIADMLSSKCCPVWISISSKSGACFSARDSANALMNCGRAPTTVAIFLCELCMDHRCGHLTMPRRRWTTVSVWPLAPHGHQIHVAWRKASCPQSLPLSGTGSARRARR